MNYGRQFVALALASALLPGIGCEKKKPQLPSQAKAPVETVSTPLPSEISETIPPPPPPEPNPQPAAQETPAQPPPKKHTKKKNPTPTPSIQQPIAPSTN